MQKGDRQTKCHAKHALVTCFKGDTASLFQNGVDFFGPIPVKHGGIPHKVQGCLVYVPELSRATSRNSDELLGSAKSSYRPFEGSLLDVGYLRKLSLTMDCSS